MFRPKGTDEVEGVDGKALSVANAQTSEDNAHIFVMNNYFGIGLDADLCLEFHMLRKKYPEMFNSRLRNKSIYVQVGIFVL